MAFVGAGTASATVICKNNLNTANCSEPYEAGAEGTASLEKGTTAVLEQRGSVLVTCTESVIKSTLKTPGSSTTTVESGLSSITWGGCNTTVDTINGGSAVLHWVSGTDNGTLTTVGTEVTVNIFGVSCTYGAGASTDIGTTVGGNPGFLAVNSTFTKTAGGFLCASTAGFKGRYIATSPTSAWVSAG